ncbi:hypothetical protein F66182_527 [Fusarium sp. NRRL 66182]|nr:hypothetical protein F66182_527 [Fusarium sp. NRRL 66182]
MSCVDAGFGPFITGCRHDFDFTLLFQYTILSIAPSVLFVAAALVRILHLRRTAALPRKRKRQHLKLAAIALYAVEQPIVLGVGLQWHLHKTRSAFISSAVLATVAGPVLYVLSWLEHSRTYRPSTVLLVYLFFSAIFDLVRSRTYWLADAPLALQTCFTLSTVCKAVLIIIEATEVAAPDALDNYTGRNSPEMVGSVFNRVTFFWMNPLFWVGARRRLKPADLFDLDSSLSTQRASEAFFQAWKDAARRHSTGICSRALFVLLRWRIMGTVAARLVLLLCTIASPLLLEKLLAYLHAKDDQMGSPSPPDPLGKGLILAFAVVYIGVAVSTSVYWYSHFRVITLVRASLVSALSRKAGVVDVALLSDPSAPLALMSSDIERISEGLRTAHELWANLIQVGIATYLLRLQVGFACVVPVGLALGSAALSLWISSMANERQKDWMQAIQTRIGLSSGVLSSSKGIKMKGLEGTLQSLIERFRSLELVQANRFRFLGIFTVMFGYTPELLSPALTFLAVIVHAERHGGKPLDATTAFTTLSLIQALAQPLNMSLQNLPILWSTFGCLNRIDGFLVSRDWEDGRVFGDGDGVSGQLPVVQLDEKHHVTAISMENAFVGYGGDKDVLTGVHVQIPVAKLTFIIGPVASGKSTLCKAIVGELQLQTGKLSCSSQDSPISYCSQAPFIRNGTVKDNIITYADYDAVWYGRVIEACALTGSLSALPKGDGTIVGSDGSRLSGGQKQKVAIARALFARNRIMVCDDVLSGLDSLSAWHVFHNVFGVQGLAREIGTTVVFSTHTIRFLPFADHVVVLDTDGRVSCTGSYEELRLSSGYVSGLSVFDSDSDSGSEDSESPAQKVKEQEEARTMAGPTEDDENDERDALPRLHGELSTYSFYFKTMRASTLVILIMLALIIAGFYAVPSYWLKIWTDSDDLRTRQYYYWGVYAGLLCTPLVSLCVFEYVSLMIAATQAGSKLHNRILGTALETSWSLLSRIDSSTIVNRLSQDLILIDGELPLGLQNLILSILLALGQAVLITVASPFVAISFPPIVAVLYLVQWFYLRTSRQLRFLDLEAKSPLYRHFTEMVNGAATIRSFSWTQHLFDESLALLDRSQRPVYLLNMAQRWLTLVLDSIVALITIIIVTIAVTTSSQSSSTGVALTQVMSTSLILRTIIVTWTRVETSLGAVSRIKDFAESTPREHLLDENQQPSATWPERGHVQFHNLTAIYTSKANKPALEHLNIVFPAGQKIGICGGSGSGKSSLTLALLHMLEYQSGTIEIDGVDLRTVPRQHLRRIINTMPQDPLAVPGTIRLNLDPRQVSSEARMLEALAKVGLSRFVDHLGGLDAEMSAGSFSHGQLQLFSLASAILQEPKIVILDEVSSSTDHHTDQIIQGIIAREFADCTVINVAHRLENIVAYDQVLVLADGHVIEQDDPQRLLDRDSHFRTMWMKQAQSKA